MCRFETFVSFSLGVEMSVLTHSLQEILEGILYRYNLEMKKKNIKKKVLKKEKYIPNIQNECRFFSFFFFLICFCKENFTVTVVSFGDVTIPKPGP